MRTTPISGLRKGAWTEEEDVLLRNTIAKYGEGKWHRIPDRAGLNRCRKSCRLRWLNYLKPDIKRGDFSFDEVDLIIRLHKLLGNRWSLIAGRLPGRTANDVKNYWNTHLFKKLLAGKIPEPKQLRPAKKIIAKQTSINNVHVVVKPKPRSFSNEKRLNIITTRDAPDVPVVVKDISPPAEDPATSVQFDQYNCSNMQYWWDHLFADENGPASAVAPGPAESLDGDIMRLLSAGGVSGSGSPGSECNQEDGGCGSTFFPPESDFWDFLFSDN